MSILDKLRSFLSVDNGKRQDINLVIQCEHCGELIETRLNLNNDLSLEDEEGITGYICRKGMMGSGVNRCYQKFELTLRFDPKRNFRSVDIVGKAKLISIN